eukprot:11465490-Prorocentrum_lima.AAC.1
MCIRDSTRPERGTHERGRSPPVPQGLPCCLYALSYSFPAGRTTPRFAAQPTTNPGIRVVRR